MQVLPYPLYLEEAPAASRSMTGQPCRLQQCIPVCGFSKQSNLANWIIRCSDDYFKPVIGHLQQKLLECDVLHYDETPVQVLKEEERVCPFRWILIKKSSFRRTIQQAA